MEKKKLLLVAVSVGVFLVIVISASILIFTPNAGTSAAAVSAVQYGAPGASIGSQERAPLASAPVEPAPSAAPPAPSANAANEANAAVPTENYAAQTNDGDVASRITINVPKPSTAAVPDTPAPSKVSTANTSAQRPAPASTATAKPAPAVAKPAAATASRPASRTAHNDYWVQTGAFSTKIRAEGVKETLSEKGITSIIENRDTDGRTLYRVRVGPYTSENEANYWLALVKSIDGFADSQIRQTSSLR